MRAKIVVEVDTDMVPGWGYDPEDYVSHIRKLLEDTIPHYNPTVTLLDAEMVSIAQFQCRECETVVEVSVSSLPFDSPSCPNGHGVMVLGGWKESKNSVLTN